MKRILFFTIICLHITLYAKEYDIELVRIYDAEQHGNDFNKLGSEFVIGGGSPLGSAIFFDNDVLVISDQIKSRTIYTDQDFNFDKIFEGSFYADYIRQNGNYIIGYNNYNAITVYNTKKGWDLEFAIDVENITSFYEFSDLFFHSDTLFVYDKQGKLWSIPNPGMDSNENIANLLNEDETIAMFENSDEIDGLTIDSNKRLILDGKIQTINFAVYHLYHKSFFLKELG